MKNQSAYFNSHMYHLAVVIFFVLFIPSCGGVGGGTGGESSFERVRFINFTTDGSAVNLELENTVEIEELAYGDATSYFEVNEGEVPVEIEASDIILPVLSENINVASGDTLTYVFSGSRSSSIVSTQITDDSSKPKGDDANIRFINFSTTESSVDVYVVFPGDSIESITPIASSLSTTSASTYTSIDATVLEVVYVEAGTKNIIRRSTTIKLTSGEAYTHALIPRLDNSKSHTSRLYVDIIP